MSVFVPVPHCLDDGGFDILPEVWESYASCLVFVPQNCFGNSGLDFFLVGEKIWLGFTLAVREQISEPEFVCGVMVCSSFIDLHAAVQVSQQYLLKRLSFSHFIFLPPLSCLLSKKKSLQITENHQNVNV